MSIVFAAITPHPPVLIPDIGKEHLAKLEKTQAAIATLAQELYLAKPESLVVISPHGSVLPDAFSINLSATYTCNFKQFGDFGVSASYRGDAMSVQSIRSADEGTRTVPLVLTSQEELDHGFGVPLHFLLAHLKTTPIIPITTSGLGYAEHLAFGEFLYHQLAKIDKRFAIVASAELSHRLTKDAPGGFLEKSKDFDKKVITMIKQKKFKQFGQLDAAAGTEALACGVGAVAMLAGILTELNVEPNVLSYEGPFGVGYPVVHFTLG